jgi:DnaJ-class molecular chaperone
MNAKCQRCKAKGVLNGDLVCPQCNGVGHLTERELIAELAEALEKITDCYGVGSSPEAFCRNVHDFMLEGRAVLAKVSHIRKP